MSVKSARKDENYLQKVRHNFISVFAFKKEKLMGGMEKKLWIYKLNLLLIHRENYHFLKISWLTYPEYYISLYVRSTLYKKRKENYRVDFFQNFGLRGYAENKIYAVWFQKWPKDGCSYNNATKMFNIKSLCYQTINCETFFKLWSEKCK